MPDPWLTENGKLHPAAEKMGMPEWEDRRDKFRLWYEVPPKSAWRTWRVQVWERFTSQSENEWLPCRDCTAHEAAALLEMDKREKLAEQDVSIYREDGGWVVYYWPLQTYLREDGKWNGKEAAYRFSTFAAALQAGILAAKGDGEGESG